MIDRWSSLRRSRREREATRALAQLIDPLRVACAEIGDRMRDVAIASYRAGECDDLGFADSTLGTVADSYAADVPEIIDACIAEAVGDRTFWAAHEIYKAKGARL
jgi:hypothetical protein